MILLVVDDHETNRKLLRAQLEAEGHAVLEAGDGLAAMAALEREPVEGIVSDILMPHLDGYGLCRKIRQDPRFAGLPVVLYTSTYDSHSDRQLAEAVGADRWIAKPAPVEVILDALHQAGHRSREAGGPDAAAAPESNVLQQYNAVLVRKLEKRNLELKDALESLRRAHREISDLNCDLEHRVEQRVAELKAVNEELESFSYSVSHDLRAPLRHIQGYIAMLQQATDGQLSDQARGHVQTISKASGEMGQLIHDLLDFSRMGRAEMRECPISLDDLVHDTIRAVMATATAPRVVWETAPLPPVVGDRALIRQALVNLLDNAVKYSRMRDPARIEIGRNGEEDGRVVLFVRDNGAGFDMQYAQKLFGVFQRLHSHDAFEGTGIGLAIVRRIVARHGGRVWANGVPDGGATFYFTLKPWPPS